MAVEANILEHGEDDIEGHIVGMPIEKNCYECRHIHDDLETCDAYPDAIPSEFLYGFEVHDHPHPGDHGIQFEPLHPGLTPDPHAGG